MTLPKEASLAIIWRAGSASLPLACRKNTGGGYFEPLGRFLAAWMPLERHYLDSTARLEDRHKNHQLVAAAV